MPLELAKQIVNGNYHVPEYVTDIQTIHPEGIKRICDIARDSGFICLLRRAEPGKVKSYPKSNPEMAAIIKRATELGFKIRKRPTVGLFAVDIKRTRKTVSQYSALIDEIERLGYKKRLTDLAALKKS